MSQQKQAMSADAQVIQAKVNFDFRQRWKEYKLQRARKKFKVYLKKHGSGDGPWVN